MHKYVVRNTIEERISSFQHQQPQHHHRRSEEGGDDVEVEALGDDESAELLQTVAVLSSPSSSRVKGGKAKKGSDDFSLTIEDVNFLLIVD